jgi:RND family efflux transporter MFP subunit
MKILTKKTETIIYLCFMVLSVFFYIACTEDNESVTERNVKGVAATLREIPDETGGFGTLSFLTKLDITAAQDGIVKKINYREGSVVRQGELVIVLENPQIVLAVERAENTFSQAKAASDLARSRLLEGEFQAEAQLLSIEKAEAELVQMKRKWEEDKRKHQNQEILFEAGGINQEAILNGRFALESEGEQIAIMEKELEIRKVGCREKDLAAAGIPVPLNEFEKRQALVTLMTASLRAELTSAVARLEAAEKELQSVRIARAELRISSEASGVVGARYFEEGERVKAGEKILTLMDTSSLYAVFPVREKDALRIRKGMEAKVQIDGTGGERNGSVDLVYPQADSQSLSFLIRVLIDGETGDLKPGMFSRVRVALGPPGKGVFLPGSALSGKKNNEAEVFIINGNTLSMRKVVYGQTLGDQWEIISGVNAGEIAVLRPDSDMREGTSVSLVE